MTHIHFEGAIHREAWRFASQKDWLVLFKRLSGSPVKLSLLIQLRMWLNKVSDFYAPVEIIQAAVVPCEKTIVAQREERDVSDFYGWFLLIDNGNRRKSIDGFCVSNWYYRFFMKSNSKSNSNSNSNSNSAKLDDSLLPTCDIFKLYLTFVTVSLLRLSSRVLEFSFSLKVLSPPV